MNEHIEKAFKTASWNQKKINKYALERIQVARRQLDSLESLIRHEIEKQDKYENSKDIELRINGVISCRVPAGNARALAQTVDNIVDIIAKQEQENEILMALRGIYEEMEGVES